MSSCLLLTVKFRFLWEDDFFSVSFACVLLKPTKQIKTKQNKTKLQKNHILAEIRNVTNKSQHCVPYLKSIPVWVDKTSNWL